jgi:hypothetical protein
MAILCRRQSSECSLSPNIAVTQTVILREHNRIAADLNDLNPHWSDERLYQGTPHWSIARPVAPQKCLIWVYDKNVNSSILKEFYRARLSVTATTWFLESKSKFVLESYFFDFHYRYVFFLQSHSISRDQRERYFAIRQHFFKTQQEVLLSCFAVSGDLALLNIDSLSRGYLITLLPRIDMEGSISEIYTVFYIALGYVCVTNFGILGLVLYFFRNFMFLKNSYSDHPTCLFL